MAKTKALISFAVTAKLICVFVFAYAKSRFSHDAAHKDLTLSHHMYSKQHWNVCDHVYYHGKNNEILSENKKRKKMSNIFSKRVICDDYKNLTLTILNKPKPCRSEQIV